MVGRIIQINIYNYTIFALCIKFQYSKTLLIQTLIQWNYRYSEVLWGSLQILYKSFYNYLLLLVYPTAFTHKAVLYREVKKPPKFTSHIITQHFIDMILIWSPSYFCREPFNGRPWPQTSPVAGVYDVGFSSTKMILFNNRKKKVSIP